MEIKIYLHLYGIIIEVVIDNNLELDKKKYTDNVVMSDSDFILFLLGGHDFNNNNNIVVFYIMEKKNRNYPRNFNYTFNTQEFQGYFIFNSTFMDYKNFSSCL